MVRSLGARLDMKLDEAQRHPRRGVRAAGAAAAATFKWLDSTLNMGYADLLIARDDYRGAKLF